MVKFGFSTKKKPRKKTKAELWQEECAAFEQQEKKQELEPEPSISSSAVSSSKSTSSKSKESKKKKKEKEEYHINDVTLVRNDSQLSHPGYDPFSAEEYIPATKRRSQFDSSVLAMREEDNRSTGTNSLSRPKEQPPQYLSYDDYYPDSNRQDYSYTEELNNDSWAESPSGPYKKSTSMYRSPDDNLDASSDEERKRKTKSRPKSKNKNKTKGDNSKYGAPTSLSDISEDKERYFRQQETRRKRPASGIGAKITEMWDNIAEGVSDTMSRFFNSSKLFFKTCFWSSSSNRTRG